MTSLVIVSEGTDRLDLERRNRIISLSVSLLQPWILCGYLDLNCDRGMNHEYACVHGGGVGFGSALPVGSLVLSVRPETRGVGDAFARMMVRVLTNPRFVYRQPIGRLEGGLTPQKAGGERTASFSLHPAGPGTHQDDHAKTRCRSVHPGTPIA